MSAISCPLALCQLPGNNFNRTNNARVISCKLAEADKPAANAKKAKETKGANASSSSSSSPPAAQYDVVLSETILFAEGGGQSSDHGTLTFGENQQANVSQVTRTPGAIVHRVDREIQPDTPVVVNVDWNRRFDHMQCHSSQHLISAIAKKQFQFKTVSWWLASAPQECHIEMDTPTITAEQLESIENECNDWIRKAVTIQLHTYDSLAIARSDESFAANIQKAIPDSHEGAVRVIEITGVEWNPCCGTHLDNTSQLQLIHLTRVEKGKTSCKVFFLTGERTRKALQAALEVQRNLTATLSCGADVFNDKVKSLQGELKSTLKTLSNTAKSLAQLDADNLATTLLSAQTNVVQLHRDELGLSFLSDVADFLAEALKAKSFASPYLLFASSADVSLGNAGAFVLVGDETKVSALGNELATKLGGKGGGRKGKMQGKATGMESKAKEEAFSWLQAQMKA